MLSGLLIFVSTAWFASQIATDQSKFGWLIALPLATAVVVNYYEYVFNPDVLSTAPGRAAGFFENPNNSGAMIAVLWALWLLSAPIRSRIRASIVGLLSLGAVLVTFSRSALICFLLVSLIGAMVLAHRQGRSVLRAVGVSLLMVFVTGIALSALSDTELSSGAQMRVESLIQSRFDDDSTLSRGLAAQRYWNEFLDHPLSGAEVFGSLTEKVGQGPHNMFLAVAADFGIFGVGGYLLVIWIGLLVSLRRGWSSASGANLLVISIWLIVISMFSHNVVYSPQGAMVLGLLLGFSASRSKPQPSLKAHRCAS
jgi:O-antigen ligase